VVCEGDGCLRRGGGRRGDADSLLSCPLAVETVDRPSTLDLRLRQPQHTFTHRHPHTQSHHTRHHIGFPGSSPQPCLHAQKQRSQRVCLASHARTRHARTATRKRETRAKPPSASSAETTPTSPTPRQDTPPFHMILAPSGAAALAARATSRSAAPRSLLRRPAPLTAPTPTTPTTSCPAAGGVVAHARYRSGGGGGGYFPPPPLSTPSVADRLIAAVPWLLPLLDAFSYGRFLFYQYPLAARAVSPLAPLVSLYASVPFAPLVCFFGLYLGVVNNPRVARFARFSAMQAVLVDILLVLPRLLETLASPPAQGWGLKAYITAQNSIWVLVAMTVLYGVVSALLGQVARVPFVAEAADAQITR
jgi:uncharacterized membrane protein